MTTMVIDAGRYPVADLACAATRQAIDLAQAQMAERGAAELDGFVSQAGLAALVADAERLAPYAHRTEGVGTAYLDPPDDLLPAGHPRRWQGRYRLGVVSYDVFPYDSLLRRLYEWEPLREFVGAILQRGPLYPYADPFGALNLAVMREDDELQWHFDQTDFVVSLALRPAQMGGEFEVVPWVRKSEREVARVLAGHREAVQVVAMAPGSLLLFEGRNSLHRVSPVFGPEPRLVALLAYDTGGGTTGTDVLHRQRYGRTEPYPRPP